MQPLPIRAWCDALGMTQSDLARAAGVSIPAVSDYARGRRNPTLRSLSALARAVGRKPWEFLRGPLPGDGLPTADESREGNIAWFSRLTPSQKVRAVVSYRAFASRAEAFARTQARRG